MHFDSEFSTFQEKVLSLRTQQEEALWWRNVFNQHPLGDMYEARRIFSCMFVIVTTRPSKSGIMYNVR